MSAYCTYGATERAIKLEQAAKTALEQLIDQRGDIATLEMFYDICCEKAEHLRCNWQDDHLASEWDQLAERVWKAAHPAPTKRIVIR